MSVVIRSMRRPYSRTQDDQRRSRRHQSIPRTSGSAPTRASAPGTSRRTACRRAIWPPTPPARPLQGGHKPQRARFHRRRHGHPRLLRLSLDRLHRPGQDRRPRLRGLRHDGRLHGLHLRPPDRRGPPRVGPGQERPGHRRRDPHAGNRLERPLHLRALRRRGRARPSSRRIEEGGRGILKSILGADGGGSKDLVLVQPRTRRRPSSRRAHLARRST